MKKKGLHKLELYFLNAGNKQKTLQFILMIGAIGLVALLVYLTGGIKYVYSHLAYIPILLCGIVFGARYGVISAIVAGILLGPLMPVDVHTQESQAFINWFIRLLIFMTVGGLSGGASTILRRYMVTIIKNNSQNQMTKIPNVKSLDGVALDTSKPYLAISVHINNFESILSTIGVEFSVMVMQNIYAELQNKLPPEATLVQGYNNNFWITILYTDYDQDLMQVYDCLNKYPVVSGVPLYIDYSLGGAVIQTQDLARSVEHFKKPGALAIAASKEKKPFLSHLEVARKKHNRYEMDILARFKEAMETGQTFLVYHPKIDLKTNKVSGLEALLRWDHPKYGMLPPDRFIPLIEETQLIQDLTYWVARVAFTKLKELKDAGLDLTMSINVSARNLYHGDFYDKFVSLVKELKISPRDVEIEVTESTLMTNLEESNLQLKKFSALGVLVSIDDFGKEYSSLAYLGTLHADIIKIDKYFTWQIEKSQSFRTIVKSTIEMAHKLDFSVNAEGVETEEQQEILKGFGCDSTQGYLYTEPLGGQAIVAWCSKFNRGDTAKI